MKRLILILLCISLTPCFAQQVSDYFPPPNVGDYWIYNADSLMGAHNPYTTIESYEAKDIINELEYFRYNVLSTLDSDGSIIVSFYSWLDEESNLAATGEISDVDSATILEPPIDMFPDDLSIGESWEMEIPGSGQIRSYYLDSFSETVNVPAGSYENCMKFIVTVEDDSGNTLAEEDYYYAEGLGKVLMVSNYMGRSELTEYSVGVSPLYVGPGEEYTTIIDAVDAANEGDLIIVRDGSYAGDILVDKSIRIRSENGFDNVFIDGVMALTVDNITVKGLSFSEWDGPGVAVLNNSSGHLIESNFFHARIGSIDINDESSSSSHITIRENTIEADSGDGITINGNYHTIDGNTISYCAGAGISVRETVSEGVTISNNYIANNGTNAVSTNAPVSIKSNTFEGNNWAQIFVNNYVGDPVSIVNNDIINGISIGLASRGSVVIDDNLIQGNSADGILISDTETAYGVITNNDIIDNAGTGIQIRGHAYIENNLITGSGEQGIYIRESAWETVTIADNDIRNNNFEGIKTRANAYIAYNFIEENEGAGIVINSMAEVVILEINYILNNRAHGVLIQMNAKLRGNTITNNDLTGIVTSADEPDLGQLAEAGENIIKDNGEYALVNENPNPINAYNNYWGTTDSTEIDDSIYDDDEAGGIGNVNFMPCLLEEPATPVEEESDNSIIPTKSELMPAYPNPFNPFTTIVFSLAKSNEVTLKVYNNLGEEIRSLINDYKNAGQYSIQFIAADLPSGVYYYRLTSGLYTDTKKLLLLK